MRIGRIDKSKLKDKVIEQINYDFDDIITDCYEPDVNFEDDKSIERYVRMLKAKVRTSEEYKDLMAFLKDKMKLDTCHYLPKAKKRRGKNLKIEMHHLAGTISDIIKIVLLKRYKLGENYSVSHVVKEVMELHYRQMISLVPVTTTIHELLHADNSTLFIPIQYSEFGNSFLFYNAYSPYMTNKLRMQFETYFEMSKQLDGLEDIIPEELSINIIYYIDKKTGVSLPDYAKIEALLDAA